VRGVDGPNCHVQNYVDLDYLQAKMAWPAADDVAAERDLFAEEQGLPLIHMSFRQVAALV